MTESVKGKSPTSRKAVLINLGTVGLSFLLSIFLLPWIVPFDPEGAVALTVVIMVLIGHAVAAIISMFVRRPSILSSGIVFCVAFAFTGWCVGTFAWHSAYLRYYAPYDRFRDNLVSPIPQSVSNLRFPSLKETIRPDLMLEFDIDPTELDVVIKRLGLERVAPEGMLNPEDLFRSDFYMPVEGTYHLFQGKNRLDEVLTVKATESHSHAVFRRESSGFYRDRSWDGTNATNTQMDAPNRKPVQHD